MPVETRFSVPFGEMVKEIMGSDSYGQTSARTHISKAYLLQMVSGKVPSKAIIEKFAEGYADRNPNLNALLVAAGYVTPTKDEIYKPQNIIDYIRTSEHLTDQDLKDIREVVDEILVMRKGGE